MVKKTHVSPEDFPDGDLRRALEIAFGPDANIVEIKDEDFKDSR